MLRDGTSKQAGKGARDRGGGIVQGVSSSQFVRLIPAWQVVGDARSKARLGDPQAEAHGSDLRPSLASGRRGGNTSPEEAQNKQE